MSVQLYPTFSRVPRQFFTLFPSVPLSKHLCSLHAPRPPPPSLILGHGIKSSITEKRGVITQEFIQMLSPSSIQNIQPTWLLPSCQSERGIFPCLWGKSDTAPCFLRYLHSSVVCTPLSYVLSHSHSIGSFLFKQADVFSDKRKALFLTSRHSFSLPFEVTSFENFSPSMVSTMHLPRVSLPPFILHSLSCPTLLYWL